MLYPEYVGVLKKVLMRFLKFEVVSGKSKSNSKLINIDCDNLDNCPNRHENLLSTSKQTP